MLMQTVALVVASFVLVGFKSTRHVGLIGFALLLIFRPVLFVALAVLTAAIAAVFHFFIKGESHDR